jgi:hypothetical protein
MAADDVFSGLVKQVLHISVTSIVLHLTSTGVVFWITAGYLYGLMLWRRQGILDDPAVMLAKLSPHGINPERHAWLVGVAETTLILGSLDAVFLAFVVVQIRYLFGGASLVRVSPGLTYAEYARRGFFELVAVAALSLPVLLAMHWLLRPDISAKQLFKVLAGVQIVLLFLVIASAVQRMRFYQSEYGLTEARLYPTAFMAWISVVMVWFALTVLRDRRDAFAFGALIAGFLLVAVLHLINPNRFIARVNVHRALAGRRFDASYNGKLGADAVPTLVDALPSLNPGDRCRVASQILLNPINENWRSWNSSRTEAAKTVRSHLDELHRAVKSTSTTTTAVRAPIPSPCASVIP